MMLLRSRACIVSAFVSAALSSSTLVRCEDWPMWRGPRGDGLSEETNVPVKWSATENIRWKTALPGLGRSSPIVYGNSVFVTSSMPEQNSRLLVRIDRQSGVVVWDKEVWAGPSEEQHRFNSSASSTPATDGKYVYCVFADDRDMQIVAVDYEGVIAWSVTAGTFSSKHGLAASPVLFDDKLIVNGYQDGSAFICALARNTGTELWRYLPDVNQRSFSTPLVVDYQGAPQMIVTVANQTVAIDPRAGVRHWYATGPSEKAVSTPSVGHGLVFSFAGSPTTNAMAVRMGGEGDVSTSHVVWRADKSMPYVPSPLLAGNYLHIIEDAGIYSCIDPTTGEVLKRVRRGGNTYSSPVFAGERVYLFEDDGTCTVIRNDATFEVIAKNELHEAVQTTPAVSQGCLFVRSDESLWCIGTKSE